MPTINLTLPVSGTVITAGLHSTNYTALQNLLNAGLDTANWATGKIFGIDKLMQNSAVDGDGIAWDNAAAIWKRTTDKPLRVGALASVPSAAVALPSVYGRLGAAVDVANTAVETTLFSQTINANDLSTNKRLVLVGSGDYLHNNGASDTITLRLKFGTFTLTLPASSLGGTIGATRRPWSLLSWETMIANQSATNAQVASSQVRANDTAGGALTISISNLDMAAIDTTVNQTLSFTAQWSAASVNNSWRLRELELLLV